MTDSLMMDCKLRYNGYTYLAAIDYHEFTPPQLEELCYAQYDGIGRLRRTQLSVHVYLRSCGPWTRISYPFLIETTYTTPAHLFPPGLPVDCVLSECTGWSLRIYGRLISYAREDESHYSITIDSEANHD